MAKFYSAKDTTRVVAGYAATAALTAGAFMIGGPILAAGAIVAVGLGSRAITKYISNSAHDNLEIYPRNPAFAPHLGEIADELYAASGLTAENHPIYGFGLNNDAETKKNKGARALIKASFGTVGQTHNAAAMNFGKPLIMASAPLLKILNRDEQKAVLAHEFTHAAANHSKVHLASNILSSGAKLSNVVAQVYAAIHGAGIFGAAAGWVAGGLAKTILRRNTGWAKILSAKNEELSLKDLARKKTLTGRVNLIGSLVTAAVITAINPAFLAVWLGVKAISLGFKAVGGYLSRAAEKQADAGAVKLGADPLALVTALRKLEAVNKESLDAALGGEKLPKKGVLTKAWRKATVSHPDEKTRVKQLSKIARKQGVSEAAIQQAATSPIVIDPKDYLPEAILRGMVA